VAELSLSPGFRRQYASIYDGLDGWQYDEAGIQALLLEVAPLPERGDFRLIGIDHSPKPRLYAPEVADRSCVHQSTPIKGNKPITLGHDYSFIGQIDARSSDTWLAVLDVQRIASQWTAVEVGLTQLMELARRSQDWLVITGDCEYSIPQDVIGHVFPAPQVGIHAGCQHFGQHAERGPSADHPTPKPGMMVSR
jgi:hypothetical protein